MIVCILDCSHITSKAILHNTLADVLELPGWYGKNLDALYDCLMELSRRTQLRVLHFDALLEALGDYAESFLDVLSDVSEYNPDFTFVMEE